MLESLTKLDIDRFKELIILIVVLYFLEVAVSYIHSYLNAYASENMIREMKENIFKKILSYKMNIIDKMGVGDMLSHLEGDVQVIVSVTTEQLLNIIVAVIKALVIGVLAFMISWPLAISVIIMVPINYLIIDLYGKKMQKVQSKLRVNMDKYYSATQEYMVGIKSLKNNRAKDYVLKRFVELINSNKVIGIQIGKLFAASSGLSQMMNFITQIIVYIMAMYLLLKGKLSFSVFVAFSAYTSLLSEALIQIIQINPNLQKAIVSIKRVNKILDYIDGNQEEWGNYDFSNLKGCVLIENVSFGYDDVLFQNLSLKFEPNKKYALVGASGSGKSSLFSLILKMYDVDKGKISIDGIDIKEISEQSYRKNIGIVEQEPIMFNMSIMENIKIGQEAVTDEEVYIAAQKANIDDEIRKMTDGNNTVINGINDNLSVGQKQRIALARVLLKNPKIILFDEVTSALDNISQSLVVDTINKLRDKHTIIVIAHRISTIVDSDEIFVLKDGKIVDHGRHEQLENRSLYYKELCKK